MDEPSNLRVRGGGWGEDRKTRRRAQLLDAGLGLLGTREGGGLTVRGACQRAGVGARYFYECFADRDELAGAVYQQVIEEVVSTTLDAIEMTESDPAERVRAGLANLVLVLEEDPRKGRVLFRAELPDELLARRRRDLARLVAGLLGVPVREGNGSADPGEFELLSSLLAGGLGEVLTGWLAGELVTNRELLVERCTELCLRLRRR